MQQQAVLLQNLRLRTHLRIKSSVLFWYFRISRSDTCPGRYRCGFATPPENQCPETSNNHLKARRSGHSLQVIQ